VQKQELNKTSQAAWYLLLASWTLVTAATLGSLFFSEVMEVPVCLLCWYQRIALYPLVLILALGLIPYDPGVTRYAGALVGLGWIIALWHVLLVAGVIPASIQPCVQGVPCSETYVTVLGFLNIPAMSLITFSLAGILLFVAYRKENP
jgi:disulfide bond formation protein DsbB